MREENPCHWTTKMKEYIGHEGRKEKREVRQGEKEGGSDAPS